MQNWWTRFVARVRGHMGWTTPTLGADGTMALVASPALLEMPTNGSAPESGGALAWLKARLWGDRISARAQLLDAVTKLTQSCEVIEQHLSRQQASLDEIKQSLQTLSSNLASLPSATAEQKRQVEHLCETVTTHRGETAQLRNLLSDVPAVLRRTGEMLDTQSAQLGSQSQSLGRLTDRADSVERTHSNIRDCVSQLGRTQEQHVGAIENFVAERHRLEQDLSDTLARTSRRLTAMVGIAIALATASTAFGVIQLFLRLTS